MDKIIPERKQIVKLFCYFFNQFAAFRQGLILSGGGVLRAFPCVNTMDIFLAVPPPFLLPSPPGIVNPHFGHFAIGI